MWSAALLMMVLLPGSSPTGDARFEISKTTMLLLLAIVWMLAIFIKMME
jgi:hypothetical protein